MILDTLIHNARLCTLQSGQAYDLIEGGWVGWRDGRIAAVGASADIPPDARQRIDAGGRLVTPGLIDCHTHLVFGGQRAQEFEMRLEGASYQAIAEAGGGIVSSVRATRASDHASLMGVSRARAAQLVGDGVTTLEIKSGYGLALDSEIRMLEVARALGVSLGVRVRTSFLGAHALPPEYAQNRAGYLDQVCDVMLPAIAQRGLADAVDAFCEGIGFSAAETRRVFEAAHRHGLPVKLHADQLSNLHGAALTAEFGGLSADHLEYTDGDGVAAMARAGTVAVLLPAAFYALRETQLPPIEAFRTAGVPMAVASDLNPGTSPIISLRLAMNMACTLFRMTPLECLLGVTAHAARALGLHDVGRIRVGDAADLVLWPFDSPAELSYWMGGLPPCAVYSAGARVAGSDPVA